MRTKIHAPCTVRVKGTEEPLMLRRVQPASRELKAQGFKGLVAHVQNERGTCVVEYTKLEQITWQQAAEYYARKKQLDADKRSATNP